MGARFFRVEHHMSTVVSLYGDGIDAVADAFFDRIRALEDVLSRFRDHSDVSRLARGELGIDHVDPSVRLVLAECDALRGRTGGDFEHEPRRRTGDPRDPVLDVDAVAKGRIVEEAATVLRMVADGFLVNAGGDVVAAGRKGGDAWRVGIQHPVVRDALLGSFDVASGAVATSGVYERGAHIRSRGADDLLSVTVVGPDLGVADGLSTAVFASGESPPVWWSEVEPGYGLLTMSRDNRLRWLPPVGDDVVWRAPVDAIRAG